MKNFRGSPLLRFRPFVSGLEQEISAAGQQLFTSVPVFKHFRFIIIDIHTAFSGSLVLDMGQKCNNLWCEEIFRAIYEIKFALSAFGLHGRCSVFLPQKRIICIKHEKIMQITPEMRQIT